jgi:hypothetical protein
VDTSIAKIIFRYFDAEKLDSSIDLIHVIPVTKIGYVQSKTKKESRERARNSFLIRSIKS